MTERTRVTNLFFKRRRVLTGLGVVFGTVFLFLGRSPAQMVNRPARQVTLFGIVADPNNQRIDRKLEKIAPQLRSLLPGHGFKLLEVQSKRLAPGQKMSCDFKANGFSATTTMVEPLDPNGKVQLRVGLYQNEGLQFETFVNTPPNQLFFCDKLFSDGSRLLIGVAAR